MARCWTSGDISTPENWVSKPEIDGLTYQLGDFGVVDEIFSGSRC